MVKTHTTPPKHYLGYFKTYKFLAIGMGIKVDMAKRAGWVRFGSGHSGCGSKRVTGQNGSFLNGLIGLRIKRVAGQTGRVKRV